MTRARILSALSTIETARGVVSAAKHVKPREREHLDRKLAEVADLLADIRDRMDARERREAQEGGQG